MLNEIKEKLEGLDMGPVQYGRVTTVPDEWNYLVFGRNRIKRGGTSRTDFNRYYTVVIVHEDYIPEGAELKVMEALEEVKGLKLAQDDIQYDYTIKKGSGNIVEMAVLTFSEVLKGYKL